MKKSAVCLMLIIVLLSVFVSARGLLDSQKNVVKISTKYCKIGTTKCTANAFQECDGSAFVTKQVCGPKESCTINLGCIKKQVFAYDKSGMPKDFYTMRLLECTEGEFVCLGRFVKVCRNHRWMQEFCTSNEVCHPKEGCVAKKKLTRFKQRNLYLPSSQKSVRLHYQ